MFRSDGSDLAQHDCAGEDRHGDSARPSRQQGASRYGLRSKAVLWSATGAREWRRRSPSGPACGRIAPVAGRPRALLTAQAAICATLSRMSGMPKGWRFPRCFFGMSTCRTALGRQVPDFRRGAGSPKPPVHTLSLNEWNVSGLLPGPSDHRGGNPGRHAVDPKALLDRLFDEGRTVTSVAPPTAPCRGCARPRRGTSTGHSPGWRKSA